MASGAGGLARGLSSGFGLGLQLGRQKTEREVTRSQEIREKAQSVNDAINQNLTAIGEILENVDANPDLSRDDPRVREALTPLIESAFQTAQQAAQTPNLAEFTVDPGTVLSQIRARAEFTPTPEQSARGEARTEVAAARETAEVAGVSEEQALAGRGVIPDPPSRQARTAVRVEDGEIKETRRAFFDPSDGVTKDENGNPLPEGFITTSVNVQDTAEGLANISPQERRTIQDQQIAASNFVSTARDTLQLIQQNPDANTLVGNIASFVNNLQAEAKAAGRAAGFEFEEDILDPSRYEQTFDDLGILNDRLKSLFVSLSFQAAMASGQSGRSVSDRDVERFLRQVGEQSSDPRALAAVLTDIATRTVRNFKEGYRVRTGGQEFEGDLGLSELPTLNQEAEETPDSGTIRVIRDEDGNLVIQ